ncbi:site-specific DNA-methyltransferase [uncultured Helicobacter sp.]|uniref:site-specific DNA-methyltransferase n=2 Tax=uncultured Helicobacter sp. TaxID=175537 RepID=UPI0025EFCCF9|nr:site-specific DNA-methyltransferase [uncultured Helicobacter sp.]
MLPRLKLARDLLKDDGVIFISIDDNEQANLKLLCDEIFGEENFVACLMWRKIEENASSGGTMKQTKTFRKDHEYILCYAKTQGEFLTKKYMELPNFEGNYKNLDNDPRGAFKAGSISMKGNKKSAKYYEVTTPSGKKYARVWRITKDEFDELDQDNRIYYGKKQDSVPQIKIFLNEERPVTPKTIFENLGSAYEASENLKKMFQIPIDNEPIFDSPKPVELIKRILEVSTSPNPANNALDSAGGGGDYKPHSLNVSHCEARSNEAIQDSKEWIATNATHSRNDKGGDSKAEGDIVLDFFASSGTTAQAVMELNAEDGGNRQFILVQLDEKIDEAKSKTAYDFCKNELGSKNPAISDITIERVKRAAQKIKNTQDSSTESSFCVYSLESKPEIINKEGHLHLKMSNSLTPFDKARNLAL